MPSTTGVKKGFGLLPGTQLQPGLQIADSAVHHVVVSSRMFRGLQLLRLETSCVRPESIGQLYRRAMWRSALAPAS